jgi:NAD(P)-dependent dehydrogenase (short-subunit alcohol dehydrogenase family)
LTTSISGKTIVITGGTSGIGEACTRHFAKSGAKVITSSIQQHEGQTLQQELLDAGHDVTFVDCDVTADTAVAALVQTALQKHSRIDAALANAGVWRQGKATDATRDDLDLLMSVNVMGPVYLAKHLAPVYK